MKWVALFLIMLISPLLSAREATPSFRALIACDMISKNIRRGSRADLQRMKKTCMAIAKQLGIPAHITVLRGKKFNVKTVSKWLSSIPCHCKDIVFFYYSGHGGRYRSVKDPWPFMIFPFHNHPLKAKSMMGGSVYQSLRKKKARLSIILFDSCNRFFQKKGGEMLAPEIRTFLTAEPELPGLKPLFLNTRGIITSCAAKPGETAVTTVNGKIIGGVFTTGFLLSMKYFAGSPDATWNQIFAGTTSYCHTYCMNRQTPVYSIETSTKNTETR